ncbi:hypothetical protein CHS0354_006235 [Potamilus streckersoni]|uniref:Uncharacterized protein n=1 Tax=Potamilus streckersoni TaxID=2493646 RepID=A0AAE0VNW3_9BIVA|nr:hypothetical protein CHS0354_006235 [Potamilus streckersoni]
MECRKLNLMVLTFLIMVYLPKVNVQTSENAKNLLYQIFNASAYNKAVRPTYEQNTSTDVVIDFYLTSIINLDSQKEKLTTSGYLTISWNDYYLQWTPATYGELTSTFIPQDNVWKPDISLQNGVSELKGLGSTSLFVYVLSNGSVYWDPVGIFESNCGIDITYFPFDIQTCTLKFVAWSYTKDEVNVMEGNKGIILDKYEENSEWSIVDTSVDTLQESIDAAVVFSIKLKRKPLFFLLNVILPVILLSLLNVCIFVLPAESGEKASFSVTVFLSLAVFLTIVTATLPQNSEKVSLLGIYLVLMANFSTLIVILTLFILRLNFRDVDEDPIPSWLIKLQRIVEVLRCRKCNKVHHAMISQAEVPNFDSGYTISTEEATSISKKSKSPTPDEKPKITWNHICNALDFVFFWIFFIATFITTVTIFSICSKNDV